jgi:hypothetical protein
MPAETQAWERYAEAYQEVSQSRDVGHMLDRTLTERAFGETLGEG